jgi:hypothetical protein
MNVQYVQKIDRDEVMCMCKQGTTALARVADYAAKQRNSLQHSVYCDATTWGERVVKQHTLK